MRPLGVAAAAILAVGFLLTVRSLTDGGIAPGSATAARATTAVPASLRRPARPALPASLRGGEWTRLPTTRRIVALTFDAGANDAGVPAILSTLRSTRTPATFFLTGHWAQYYPAVARAIAVRYPVGDHTWTHPDLTRLTDSQVRRQILTGARLIRAATGRTTRPLFRFPYGSRDARTIRIVNSLGYGSIRWSVDTLGWMGTSGGQSVQSALGRVVSNLRPGEIVLMHVGSNPHDNSTIDAAALPAVIRAVRARGFRFVTLPGFIRSSTRHGGT